MKVDLCPLLQEFDVSLTGKPPIEARPLLAPEAEVALHGILNAETHEEIAWDDIPAADLATHARESRADLFELPDHRVVSADSTSSSSSIGTAARKNRRPRKKSRGSAPFADAAAGQVRLRFLFDEPFD